jgi:hypothetical protein
MRYGSNTSSACHIHSPTVASTAAKAANELLWSDWQQEKTTKGVLLRVPDIIDKDDDWAALNIEQRFGDVTFQLLPASFLHASMRPSNPMFGGVWTVGVLIGSKLNVNHQKNKYNYDRSRRNANNYHGVDHSKLVKMSVCYPGDAGLVDRKSLDGTAATVLLTNHGGTCRYPKQHSDFCINDTCLMDRKCQCTKDTRYSHGDYYADHFQRTQKNKSLTTTFFACWYDPSRIDEMVDAYNSLWLQRSSWCKLEPSDYWGWNECPATRNVADRSSIDAIVIQTPLVATPDHSNLCHQLPLLTGGQTKKLTESLKRLHRRYGHLPVLFLGQSQGMNHNTTLCDTYWKGVDCDNGARKWFFAQSFHFSDGSCLAKPEKCEDVYYFPDCNVTTTTTTPNPCLQIPVLTTSPSASGGDVVMTEMIEPYHNLPSHSTAMMIVPTLTCFLLLVLRGLSKRKRFRFRLAIRY